MKKITLAIIICLAALWMAPAVSHAKKIKFRVDVTPTPPGLSVSVKFSEPSGNGLLESGESGDLSITIHNAGPGDAYGVVLALSDINAIVGLEFRQMMDIGTIPAHQRVTRKVELRTTTALISARAAIGVEVSEAGGFDADPLRIAFDTRAFEPPRLKVVDMAIDDQNGNSRVEPMENVELKVRVQNMGHGDARNVSISLVPGGNVFVGGQAKSFKVGRLGPAQYVDVAFMFYTNKRIRPGQSIPLTVQVDESRDKFALSHGLDIKMSARQKSVREFVVKGTSTPKGKIRSAVGLTTEIDRDIPVTAIGNRDAIAVVIGNRDYINAKPVEYAINDAKSMRNYLVSAFGFREGNIFYLTNASKGDFQRFFGVKGDHKGKLFNAVKAGRSDVFVFYSGHGAPGLKDGKGYFVPVEADPQYLNLEGYPADVLFENLAKIPARNVTVVLDACFSGATIYENISPMVIEIKNPIAIEKGVVMASSTGSQVSSWYGEKEHGMFTYFFLKAIHKRNADSNRDGNLTFQEVFNYIADKSDGVPYQARRLHGVEQDPTIQGQYKGKLLLRY